VSASAPQTEKVSMSLTDHGGLKEENMKTEKELTLDPQIEALPFSFSSLIRPPLHPSISTA